MQGYDVRTIDGEQDRSPRRRRRRLSRRGTRAAEEEARVCRRSSRRWTPTTSRAHDLVEGSGPPLAESERRDRSRGDCGTLRGWQRNSLTMSRMSSGIPAREHCARRKRLAGRSLPTRDRSMNRRGSYWAAATTLDPATTTGTEPAGNQRDSSSRGAHPAKCAPRRSGASPAPRGSRLRTRAHRGLRALCRAA
jgi:hypothetical protein